MDETTAAATLKFVEDVVPEIRGAHAKSALARLEERRDEIHSAIRWFVDHARTNDALRLASRMSSYWTATKRSREGIQWFDVVLAAPGGDDARRGQALHDSGLLSFWLGDDERSTRLHEKSLEIGRRIGDPTITALALAGLARVALRTTGTDEARRLCLEAVELTEGTSDRIGRSSAVHVLGVTAQIAGDLAEARKYMSERMALARELGNLAAVGIEAGNLSMVERRLGNLDRAEALAKEALEIYASRSDEWAVPFGLSGMAAIAAERGDSTRAATLLGAAEASMEAQGTQWPPDERIQYDQTVATLANAMGEAEFAKARANGRAMSWRDAAKFAGERQSRSE
jgi:tetratricopeptide (TPR) repeat protein